LFKVPSLFTVVSCIIPVGFSFCGVYRKLECVSWLHFELEQEL
jgi:hypothetical protein